MTPRRYQQKSRIFEDLSHQASGQSFKKEQAVSTLLRKANKELISMVETLSQELISERCRNREIRAPQKVAQCSGEKLTFPQIDPGAMRAEEYSDSRKAKLYAYLDDQIKLSEASLKKWFQVI
jgi:hypothetical protein